jgi:hypothetical protein
VGVRTIITSPPTTCVRCGTPLPPPAAAGRTRLWCSGRCKKAAYEARRSAREGAFEVKVVERVLVQEHNITECVRRVVQSPAACRHVLHELRRLATARILLDDPKWKPTLRAFEGVQDAIGFVYRGRRW